MTPLFPEDGKIEIAQGGTGDCYLLATLDCIFSSGSEGISKVKSMFTKTENGVEVRIKRTPISSNLKVDKIENKYDYFYDTDRNEDVFIISKKRLEEIDSPSGVKTNSLAVKIIEHLSSYYYVEDWSHKDDMNSILAHNLVKRHKVSSTKFMGYLLGIKIADQINIDLVIKLKTFVPDYPIYASMNHGKKDEFGNIHGRHAFRIKEVIPNSSSPGGYDFIFVNPWNNQKKEIYSLNDIKSRKPRFTLFDTNPTMTRIALILVKVSENSAQCTPQLFNLLLELDAFKPGLNEEEVKRNLMLYKKMPQMILFFNNLQSHEKRNFLKHVYDANGDEDSFLASLLSDISCLKIPELLRLNNGRLGPKITQIAVSICFNEKNNELFGLLNRVDFLEQINNTSLSKDVFLRNLIELHLNQPNIAIEKLNEIVIYIKQYNKDHTSSPITVDFSEEAVFKLAIDKAVNEKTHHERDKENQRKEIEEGLVRYYFSDRNHSITRAGGLRSLFELHHYPKELIEKIDSHEWVPELLKMLKNFPGLKQK